MGRNTLQLIKSVGMIAMVLGSLSIFSTGAIAQTDREEWVSFGKMANAEVLKLDRKSIKFRSMLIDDTINEEGGYEGKVPRIQVVAFDYSIGGRKRIAYTKSCKGSSLGNRPSWRTSTSFVDYWPKYFQVEADSIPSQKMLQMVCSVSADLDIVKNKSSTRFFVNENWSLGINRDGSNYSCTIKNSKTEKYLVNLTGGKLTKANGKYYYKWGNSRTFHLVSWIPTDPDYARFQSFDRGQETFNQLLKQDESGV
jgi:hypothetical protein